MSFGRSLMNGVTLGAWGWLTDPDITEFYFEVPGKISYRGSGDGAVIAKALMNKFGIKETKPESRTGYFKSMKDVVKAMELVYNEYNSTYKRRDLSLLIEASEYATMTPKDKTYSFVREAPTTHCKTCGSLLAYGKRAGARWVKCSSHPKAGKFVVPSKMAASHRWYYMEASWHALEAYEIGRDSTINIDEEEEDD